MYDTEEGRLAKRILNGLERGGADIADLAVFIGDIDPVLVHAIVSYVREAHPVSTPDGPAVLKRLVELTAASPDLQARNEEGARDPIAAWLKSSYNWGEFRGRSGELVDLIVDKLES